MANELKHGSVGTELTQTEWEAVGAHVFANQAAGDIMYASTTAQLSRLAKGADNTVLHLASGIPAWSATLAGLTLTTPTISSTGFANANHAHAASNSGGTVAASTLSGTSLASGVVTTSATTVGVLNSGSINTGFGTINNGSSTITTTGAITGGSLVADNITLDGNTISTDGITTLNAATGQHVVLAVAGTTEFQFTATKLDMNSNTLTEVGAATNEWLQNSITLAGGTAAQDITVETTGTATAARLTLKAAASSTVDHAIGIVFQQGDGTGSANNMRYLLTYDAGAAYMKLRSVDIDGSSTDGDIWRVVDGTDDLTMVAGNIDMNSAGSVLNVGASGNDWAGASFTHGGLGTTSDAMSSITRTTANTEDPTFVWTIIHKSTGTAADGLGPSLAFRIADGSISGSAGNLGRVEFVRAGADNTGEFNVTPYIAGSRNVALKLTSAGVLSVDLSGSGSAAQVDLFDQFDDATELQRFAYSGEGVEDVVPGVTEEQRLANRERMVEMGIITPVAGAASGYHMQIQPLMRLLAGGIYQTRHRVDARYDELNRRLEAIGA